jgi:predicted CoA-substrate-specific enzyme activase
MRTVGIDIGSRTVKLAVVEDGHLIAHRIAYNTHEPIQVCRELLDDIGDYDRLAATGYGRHLFGQYWPCEVITEIKAASLGTRAMMPSCHTILDIGGQDTKTIALETNGAIRKFEMNDRCAAGTGKFLEIMASALAYTMEDFIDAANQASASSKINSMCTVFAESEVVSLVARGIPRDELALGLHQSIVARSISLLKRIPLQDDVVFIGGVAHNSCLHRLLCNGLERPLLIPPSPQIAAAFGAALSANCA